MKAAGLEGIQIDVLDEGVTVLRFRRPKTLNALDNPAIAAAGDVVADVAGDQSVRTLVLAGDERAFSTGSDLEEALQADVRGHLEHWRLGHRLVDALEALPIPVIAAINGWALGGGCEIALACDIRIAGESATLGLPEVQLGAIPGWGGTQRLPRVIGESRAFELLVTGDRVSAEEAQAIGLVNRVVPDDRVLETAIELAARIATAPRHTLTAAKRLVHASRTVEPARGEQLEVAYNTQCVIEPAFSERVEAFLSRRKGAGANA